MIYCKYKFCTEYTHDTGANSVSLDNEYWWLIF